MKNWFADVHSFIVIDSTIVMNNYFKGQGHQASENPRNEIFVVDVEVW